LCYFLALKKYRIFLWKTENFFNFIFYFN
jgi:hypothetical protein